ncbi:MAG: hypothetical protein M3P18_10220 [Actinomycetota bacterium]|nr:hypothetical protein [Actinomycetota bacterium]
MLEIPPNFPPLKTLAASHERQSKAHKAAKAELRELEAELVTAAEKDRRAFADRLAKDVSAKNPGEREQEKVRAKITETKARRDALKDTVSDAEQALEDEIKANYEKWLASEAAAAEKARRAYAEAVEALAVKGDELAARQTLVRWLETPGRPYKEVPAKVHSRILLKPNGTPLEFAKLVDALREDAKPADEREDIYARPRFGPFAQPPAVEPEPELDRVA